MANSLNVVQAWFQQVQFREAPSNVLDTYARALDSGLLTAVAIQGAIVNDPFTQSYVNPVIRLYQAAFNRIPDQSGQNFWVDNLAAGNVTTQDLANAFANSQEFKDLYGISGAGAPVTASLLTAFYQNVLQRAPDPAGYQYWLNSGVTVGQILNYFANSAEFISNTGAVIELYQLGQLNQTLPTESVSLWHFVPPEPVPQPTPQPGPEVDSGPAPDPTTFTVTNTSGSLAFGGTATGDVTFTVASDGTATFTRGGVVAASTFNVSTIAGAPETIKLSANAQDLSVASATALVNIVNYDPNGHTYSLLDSLATLLTVTSLTVSYKLSDNAGSLGALTVATADVVEAAANAADYSYTVADTIAHANALNFTTAYAHNLGVNLTGSSGSQTVTGSGYADTIDGGDGGDTIVGGAGADDIAVGVGSNLVVLNAVASSAGTSDSDLTALDTVNGLGADDFVQINATGVTLFDASNDVTQVGAHYWTYFNGVGYGPGYVMFINNGWEALNYSYVEAQARTILNLTGTTATDSIIGGQNNDTITGGAGQDTMYGGSGDDIFIIASGADHGNTNTGEQIYGESGLDVIRFTSTTVNDSLNVSYFVDVEEIRIVAADGSPNTTEGLSINVNWLGDMQGIAVYGNAGSNTLVGNEDGFNTIVGGGGNDSIVGGDRADSLVGGSGSDTIIGHDGVDIISGGAGDNYYVYTTNAEFVSSGAVVDSITGGEDTDAIQINAAITLTTSDTLATRLVSVEKLIAETQSLDTRAYSIEVNTSSKLGTVTTIDLSGDTNAASTGVITMIGVSTGLTLIGVNGGGSNTISGGAGNDSITGGIGADTLRGGNGSDTIFGGDGNDSIVGNAGADCLTGGGGNDVFTYSQVADWSSSEMITDFANSALNAASISNGALSSINGDIFLFDLSNLAAVTGYVALGTTVTSGVSTLVAGDWAIGAADQAHAQFVLVGSDTLAFDPDGTGGTAAITVVGHYTYTGLTGTMIALTA